jgi:hypothetical protein
MSSVQFFSGYSVQDLQTALSTAEVKTSFWGQRQVVIADRNIKIDLLLLRDKVVELGQTCQKHVNSPFDPSFLRLRFSGEYLARRVNNLIHRSNEHLKTCNLFTQTLAWIRQLPRLLDAACSISLEVGAPQIAAMRAFVHTFFKPLDLTVSTVAFRTFSKEEFSHLFLQNELHRGAPLSDVFVNSHPASLGCVDLNDRCRSRRWLISERAFLALRLRFSQNSDFERVSGITA